MKTEIYERKLDAPEELFARILDSAASVKKRADQPRRQTRELQGALTFTVGFSNTYCEL
jgi:hypothetical protein